MKKQYEMSEQEFDDMKAISQDKTPVMNIGGNWTGMDKQERANAFWVSLADKYGFVWDTVEGAGTGNVKEFLATPKSL